MNKRIMAIVADGVVYQKGKVPVMPASVAATDANQLKIVNIYEIFPDEGENFYQIICIPNKGTEMEERDVAFVIDIPERKRDVIVSYTNASQAKEWIDEQRTLDRLKAEEEASAGTRSEEESESEEEQSEAPAEEHQAEVVDGTFATPPSLTSGLVPVLPASISPAWSGPEAVAQIIPSPLDDPEAPLPLIMPDDPEPTQEG